MMKVLSYDKCCGCGSCVFVCPQKAINLKSDKEGFSYPKINYDLCVECGLCQKSCIVLNKNKLEHPQGNAYGAINKDDTIRYNSTSGGAFSAFAESILSAKGIIYGAASIENIIRHTRVDERENLSKLRGSKYVQSNLDSTFIMLESDLKDGKKVMFTGTPCQCAGLKSYLMCKKVKMDNLVLVDFVCHGVCSPKVYEEYIKYCNDKYTSNISEHRFRCKINGWKKHTEANILENGSVDTQSFHSQLFKSFFHSHFVHRPSCFNCEFSSVKRVSDVTMADFWGIENSIPNRFDSQGVSFLLANSIKGEQLIKSAVELEIFSVKLSDTENPCLYSPAKSPKNRNEFWKIYERRGFVGVANKYFHAGKTRRFITDCIKRFIGRQ